MSFGGRVVCAFGLALGLLVVRPASAQISAYGEFTASKLTNLVQTRVLYGATFGVTAEVAQRAGLHFAADLRGQVLDGAYNLKQLAVGPRVSGRTHGFDPYGEFLVGFGRLNYPLPPNAGSSSDSQIQLIAGIDRRISSHLDARLFEYTYEQYYGLGGQFNPKTFSTGIVYRFAKR